MSLMWSDSLILGLAATVSGVILACFSMLLKSKCKDFKLCCLKVDCIPSKDTISPSITRQNTIKIPNELIITN